MGKRRGDKQSMNLFAVISSDNRELYKADIYKTLALPKGYIIHFRYKKKHVDEDILYNKKVVGKKAVIFFAANNKPEFKQPLKHIPLRLATISHAEICEETNLFHVFLKLEEFCSINAEYSIDQNIFFTKLHNVETKQIAWQKQINSIIDFFPDTTFFHLHGIYNSKKESKIHNKTKSSCYKLTHGAKYCLKISLANPKNSDTTIKIFDSSKAININQLNPLQSSVQFDDLDIPIYIKHLSTYQQFSLLSFAPENNNKDFGEYITNIELNLIMRKSRIAYFGLLTTLALCSSAALINAPSNPTHIYYPIFASILVVSSGLLFALYNKK